MNVLSQLGPPPAYCQFFCEENVWHLCEHPRVTGRERFVLFISNRQRRVAMWAQRAAGAPDQPLAWDYHVVLLVRGLPEVADPHPTWAIWDLDSTLVTPAAAEQWLAASFAGLARLPPYFAPRFRLVSAADYRRHFRSDRSHMRRHDGQFKQPPPSWPPILGTPVAGEPNNLERFSSTEDETFLGECMDLPTLRAWLRRNAPASGRSSPSVAGG